MAALSFKAIWSHRVRSSSIIEVTTAMIIISMVFGLAIVIYLNLQRTGVFSQRLSARIKLESVFSETNRLKKYENRDVNFEDIVIYQKVDNSVSGFLTVVLEARDEQGKLIAEQKHFVYAP
jgi:hypothetical protein